MRENRDQKNSEYGRFLRSDKKSKINVLKIFIQLWLRKESCLFIFKPTDRNQRIKMQAWQSYSSFTILDLNIQSVSFLSWNMSNLLDVANFWLVDKVIFREKISKNTLAFRGKNYALKALANSVNGGLRQLIFTVRIGKHF